MSTGMFLLPTIVIGTAVLYYWFVGKRGGQRNRHHLCARCGQPLDTAHAYDLAALVVCPRCARTTERNGRAAQCFAIGAVLLMVALMVFGFGLDFVRGGHIDANGIKVIAVTVVTATAFLSIFRKNRITPVRRESPSE